MTAIIIFIVAYLELAQSQYYSQPTFQPYSYFQSPTPVAPSMYAPQPSPAAYPPIYASQPMVSPYSTAPSYAPTLAAYPPFGPPPTYSTPYAPFAPIPANLPTYPTMISSKPPSTPKTQIGLSTPKCSPPTATAYYITATESPKAGLEKVKQNLKELPAPTYPCPFCTGFANVPKNSKVPPPPPCSSVLPGILDKIPTIVLPDELKLKKLDNFAKPCPLLEDLFEHKLSGKLRFDEDLLDGFLTGLGLGK